MKIITQLFFILSIFLSIGASRDPMVDLPIDVEIAIEDGVPTVSHVAISEMYGVDTGSICKTYISNAVAHCLQGNLEGFRNNIDFFYQKCFLEHARPRPETLRQRFKEALKIESAKYNVTTC